MPETPVPVPQDPQLNFFQNLIAGETIREIIQSYRATVNYANEMAALAEQERQDKQALENRAMLAETGLQTANDALAALRASLTANRGIPEILTASTNDLAMRAWQVMTLYGFSHQTVRSIYQSSIVFMPAAPGERSQFGAGPPPYIKMTPEQANQNPFLLHELLHAAIQLSMTTAQLNIWESQFYPLFEDAALNGDPKDEGIRAIRTYYYGLGQYDPDDRREHLVVYTLQRLMGRYKALPQNLWPACAGFLTGEPLINESWDNPLPVT